jgi:hypothetical protein
MLKSQIACERGFFLNMKFKLRLELKLELKYLNAIFSCSRQVFTEIYTFSVYLLKLEFVALRYFIAAWVLCVIFTQLVQMSM